MKVFERDVTTEFTMAEFCAILAAVTAIRGEYVRMETAPDADRESAYIKMRKAYAALYQ